MKIRKSLMITGAGLAAALVTVVIGLTCSTFFPGSRQKPIDNAVQIYAEATAALLPARDLSYTVTQTKEQVIGSKTFKLQGQQTVRLEHLQDADFRGSVTETLKAGGHTVSVSEIFSDDTGYFTVEDTCFTSKISKEAFLERCIPAVPVTVNLYSSITGYVQDKSYVILFEQPSGPEPWVQIGSASFVSSAASVTISRNGQLEKTVYNATCTDGNSCIFLSVTVEINETGETPITIPEGPFTDIGDPNILRMLEIACGYLLEQGSVTSHYEDQIHCQAFGDLRTQTITLNAVNADTWSSLTETQITVDNTGNIGVGSTLTKKELYQDGVLKTVIDGAEQPVTQQSPEAVRTHCQDILVGTIILPQYIESATVVEDTDTYRMEFAATETFSTLLSDEACATLYQNTEILREHAEDYTANTSCYLTINKTTGLPVSSGFRYVGVYVMDGLPYRLEFSADQQYELLNDTAHKRIEAGA